ncbi:DUF4870 domain-containing protein [Leifsonia sp. Leaf264]|uniref:DUF4870 domain-containing protein n=1 Tax=Leifsonia sp. Leaf264 TaxID=1736314 RepID=UPI0006F38ACA|nr:DUF4870 domain-containing protein [Leifsonia sp. Leaf264]KQO98222.1 hypothetical protein ASF30_09175 [Leifsonia sp. Leaf264]
MFISKPSHTTRSKTKDLRPEPKPYAAMPFDDQRTWATVVHTLGLFFGATSAAYAYWLLRKRGAYIHENVRAALNWEFSITMYMSLLSVAILLFDTVAWSLAVVLFVWWVWHTIGSLAHMVAAHKGVPVKPRLTVRIFR